MGLVGNVDLVYLNVKPTNMYVNLSYIGRRT